MYRPIVSLIASTWLATGAFAQTAATQPTAPPRRGLPQIVIGPSAPVPEAVAMPTAEQIDHINSEIKKLVGSDSSSSAALLKNYEYMFLLPPAHLNTAATFTQTQQRMGPRHLGFVETAQKGDIDLLLEGDSITDWWQQGEEKTAMFKKYFSQYKTADFAIAGDTTQGNLWGLKNGEGQGFSPKAVMLMIGTNNMGPNSAPEIAEGIGAVVVELRKDFPNAKILLLAIFPRGLPNDPIRDRIAVTNKIISRLDDGQHVFYMDIGPKFLGEDGAFLPGAFQADNLHPTARGYDLWGAAVKDKIASLMQ